MLKRGTRKSLKVAVDTNILYSALLYKGNEHLLVEASTNDLVEVYISEYVLNELQEVLKRINVDKRLVCEFINENKIKVIEDSTIREDDKYIENIDLAKKIPHKSDRPVFMFAIVFTSWFKDGYFVSGDKHFTESPLVKKKLRGRLKRTKEILDAI